MNICHFPCPVWGNDAEDEVPYVGNCNIGILYAPRVYSPRAGGLFQAGRTNSAFNVVHERLQDLTPRERANLSHWIYRHNWDTGLLQPRRPRWLRKEALQEAAFPADQCFKVTEDMEADGFLVQPKATDRLLCFLRELIWQLDRSVQAPDKIEEEWAEYWQFLWAASACANEEEVVEFWEVARQRNWLQETSSSLSYLARYPARSRISLEARLWLEGQERERGAGQQGFIPMWMDDSMKDVYDQGFRKGIEEAGYKARRIDDDPNHSDNLVDRILAEIRRSRFVVADFTCGLEQDSQRKTLYLDRGGVYYEAGFAYGLGIPVIHTCRKDVVDNLHFDIRQLNHLLWEEEENLENVAGRLQAHIEHRFGQGPLSNQYPQVGTD